MKNEPVFLTDKNHNIVLEAFHRLPMQLSLIPANPLKSWSPQPLRAQRKNIFR